MAVWGLQPKYYIGVIEPCNPIRLDACLRISDFTSHGETRSDTARHGETRSDTVRHGRTRSDTVRHGETR